MLELVVNKHSVSSLGVDRLNPQHLAQHLVSLPRGGGRKPSKEQRGSSLGRAWFKLPHPARYFVSGNGGTVCFFLCDRLVYFLLTKYAADLLSENVLAYKDSICFLSGYLLHIVMQHYLHALLVFGLDTISTKEKYWQTLMGTYRALISVAIGSTVLDSQFLRMGMPRNQSFVATLVIFAFVNYFWITSVVARSEAKQGGSNKGKNKPRRPSRPAFRGGSMMPEADHFPL